MKTEKRTMRIPEPKKVETKLGSVLEGVHTRDAIHIAVTAVSADVALYPGQHVGLVEGTTDKVSPLETPIGIVDPFITHQIPPGSQFWLVLYPQTITSLKHEWTHPAFDFEAKPVLVAPPPAEDPKVVSERWLRDFCAQHEGIDYGDMLQELSDPEGYCTQQGSQSAQDAGISAEFQHHFTVVTGRPVLGHFSCSC